MSTLAGDPVALVLAAGRSTRLGPNKLLEPVAGRTLIERTVSPFLETERVRTVVVVVRAGAVGAFSWLAGPRVHLVTNPDPGPGMITSIRCALGSSWAKGRDFLVTPADMPFIPASAVQRIVSEFLVRPHRIVIPTYRRMGGHPGMFAASLTDEFFRHGDRNGVKEILLRHRDETFRLPLPEPDICFDVDTPEDLRAAPDPEARWARVERALERRNRPR